MFRYISISLKSSKTVTNARHHLWVIKKQKSTDVSNHFNYQPTNALYKISQQNT